MRRLTCVLELFGHFREAVYGKIISQVRLKCPSNQSFGFASSVLGRLHALRCNVGELYGEFKSLSADGTVLSIQSLVGHARVGAVSGGSKH